VAKVGVVGRDREYDDHTVTKINGNCLASDFVSTAAVVVDVVLGADAILMIYISPTSTSISLMSTCYSFASF
jgi:hypothetical protein